MAVDQSQARKNFKSQLYKRGWTAKEVAAKIELSERTLYNWMAESNPKNLGSGSLVRLAHLFNVDPEEFMGAEGLAGLDEENVTIDETRDSLLEELRGLIDGIDDENDLIQVGDILAGRAARPRSPKNQGVSGSQAAYLGPSLEHLFDYNGRVPFPLEVTPTDAIEYAAVAALLSMMRGQMETAHDQSAGYLIEVNGRSIRKHLRLRKGEKTAMNLSEWANIYALSRR